MGKMHSAKVQTSLRLQNVLAVLTVLFMAAWSIATPYQPTKAELLQMEKIRFDREYHASIRQAACPWAEGGNCANCHK